MEPPGGAAPSDLAIKGRYGPTPDGFASPGVCGGGSGGEIQLTDGIRGWLRRRPVYAYEYAGRRHDCGTRLGYLRATVEVALQHEDVGAAFRQTLEEVLGRR